MAMAKMTLKAGGGSIEVSSARVARETERMFKLSEPRRAHRLEKAKALLAGKAGAGDAKASKGKKKKAAAAGVSPAVKQAAAIALGQGVSEL
jgi:hypothetical protein